MNRFSRGRTGRKGFTFVELLACALIIALLTCIFMSALKKLRKTATEIKAQAADKKLVADWLESKRAEAGDESTLPTEDGGGEPNGTDMKVPTESCGQIADEFLEHLWGHGLTLMHDADPNHVMLYAAESEEIDVDIVDERILHELTTKANEAIKCKTAILNELLEYRDTVIARKESEAAVAAAAKALAEAKTAAETADAAETGTTADTADDSAQPAAAPTDADETAAALADAGSPDTEAEQKPKFFTKYAVRPARWLIICVKGFTITAYGKVRPYLASIVIACLFFILVGKKLNTGRMKAIAANQNAFGKKLDDLGRSQKPGQQPTSERQMRRGRYFGNDVLNQLGQTTNEIGENVLALEEAVSGAINSAKEVAITASRHTDEMNSSAIEQNEAASKFAQERVALAEQHRRRPEHSQPAALPRAITDNMVNMRESIRVLNARITIRTSSPESLRRLENTIRGNDVGAVRQYMDAGVLTEDNVNNRLPSGNLPLGVALGSGAFDVAYLLRSRNASFGECVDKSGKRPNDRMLEFLRAPAAANEQAPFASALAMGAFACSDVTADVEDPDDSRLKTTLYLIAHQHGADKVIRFFHNRYGELSINGFRSVKRSDGKGCIQLLLEHIGSRVNSTSDDTDGDVVEAIRKFMGMEILTRDRIDDTFPEPNPEFKGDKTNLLCIAIQYGLVETVGLLLDNGADSLKELEANRTLQEFANQCLLDSVKDCSHESQERYREITGLIDRSVDR